jgi:HEAT repeat protein
MEYIFNLIEDLKSEEEAKRNFAVNDLGRMNDERSIIPLVELLKRETSVIIRESIFSALAQIKSIKSIEALVDLLRSDEAFIRNQAITVLNEKGSESIEPLGELLKDPDKDVRKLALDSLFSFEHPESAKIIVEAFDDPAINVRITAVEYIGRMEAREYSDRVLDLFMKSDNILLTCACLESLAVIGNKVSLEAIKQKYADSENIDPLILFSYIKILGALGDTDSFDILTNFLYRYGTMLSKEIIQSIQKISRKLKIQELPEKLFSALAKLSIELDEMDEYSILNLLSNFQNKPVFQFLIEKLDSDKRMVKLGAIEGLGNLGDPEAIPSLEKILETEEDEELVEVINDSIENLK